MFETGGSDEVMGREHMAAVRAVVSGFSSAFDPNLVSAADALRIAADATAVANMAEYIKAMAYARAAQTSLSSDEGDKSAAHNMARKSGSSLNDWAKTKVTLASCLDWLCKPDHDKKTYDGWALVEGHGKRPMVPPDDPRHPRHKRSEAQRRAG